MFLTNSNYLNRDNLIDEQWLCRLAYLSGIFSRVNELNLSLQGVNNSVFHLYDKISAFKRKLRVMQQQIEKQNANMFPSLCNFIEENNLSVKADMISDIKKHLTSTFECL
ncbi:Zinc finger BED domain-containing protein 5, partial [Stegodyphus mimosarum]